VPKLPSATGEAMTKAVVDCLEDWTIKDRVQAMSFDTTSSNTEVRMGACKLIEFKLVRDLLHFACHHHVMEIVAEKAFASCDMPSTDPEILLFKRFKQQWKFIDKEKFEVIDVTVVDQEEIIEFCKLQLIMNQP